MKKTLTVFLFYLCSLNSWGQHFGFSYEVSSYVPAGSSEVQISGVSATVGKNKVTRQLLVVSLNQVAIVNETNGKVVSRFGGDGHMSSPTAIATDGQGIYYIANNNHKILKYDANGKYLLEWGSQGAADGQFNYPQGICTDDVNNIYVADQSNNRIQKFDASGNFITKWGTTGTGNGQFKAPYSVAYWPSLASIVVADYTNERIQTFSKTGVYIAQAAMPAGRAPSSLDIDVVNNKLLVLAKRIFQFDNNLTQTASWGPDGTNNTFFSNAVTLAVSDYSSPTTFSRVFAVENYKLISFNLEGATNGTIAGNYGIDGTLVGQYSSPISADFTSNVSNLYVLDRGRFDSNTQLFSATLNKATTVKTSYPMKDPAEIVLGANDQYILDRTTIPTPSNHIEVHRFDLNNNYLTKISFAIINVSAMAIDPSGNFYFAKQNGAVYSIYKYDNAGTALTNWTTTSSALAAPSLATDASSNLYITDVGNNMILKYNNTGTLLNTFGSSGTGNGQLSGVLSIDVDGNGNIYALQSDRLQVFNSSFTFLQRANLTAGIQPGSVNQPFLVRANNAGTTVAILDKNSDRVQYFIVKTDQTINFGSLPAKNMGDSPFTLSATGGASGNAITFTSSNPAVATISGSTVTIVGSGTTSIVASQAGNGGFNPATDVPQNLTVSGKLDQIITFSALPNKVFNPNANTFTLSSPGVVGGASGNAVTFASSNSSVATISGNTITITGAGMTTITASQAGNANYNPALDVPQSFTVTKADQTITFNTVSTQTFSAVSLSLVATSTSGLMISFSTLNDEVTIVGSQVTLLKPGYITINANQGGNSNYNAASQVPQSFCINPAKPIISETMNDTASPILSSSSATGNQWFLNGVAITEATNSTLSVTEVGEYTVTASAASCVSAPSDPYSIVVTAIELNNKSLAISCTPNPTTDFITIMAPKNNDALATVLICNTQGQTMINGGIEHLNEPIRISHYPSGVYIIHVVMNGNKSNLKFIKK